MDLGLETTAGVLSLESGTSSQRLSYVALSHRTGLRSLSWRCLWTTCSFWPGLQICSLGLCLSWPTFRHLSSSWPRAAKRSSESSCYHCSFAKMSDKASGVCSLNVWWNSLGKSFGSGLFFGGSFLINNLFTCYRCSGFLSILKASWVFCVFLGICSFHSWCLLSWRTVAYSISL